jgi:hypothetical protein
MNNLETFSKIGMLTVIGILSTNVWAEPTKISESIIEVNPPVKIEEPKPVVLSRFSIKLTNKAKIKDFSLEPEIRNKNLVLIQTVAATLGELTVSIYCDKHKLYNPALEAFTDVVDTKSSLRIVKPGPRDRWTGFTDREAKTYTLETYAECLQAQAILRDLRSDPTKDVYITVSETQGEKGRSTVKRVDEIEVVKKVEVPVAAK